MFNISKDAWLFTFKTTIAAIIALYISLAFNLDNPGWAVTTVFIASQPFSSSTLSKGLYRFLGTFLGATGALILVSNFVDTPIILCTALALWTATCLYISLQDRSPRSYMFMLAGYTISFIAFPSVSTPENIFTISISRVQEILIGVTISGVIHSIVLPNQIFKAVKHTLDRWISDVYKLIGVTLEHQEKKQEIGYEILHSVANYPLNLERLADHLQYDGRRGRQQAILVENIQYNMRQIIPIISSIDLRVNLIGAENLPETLDLLIQKLKHWSSDQKNEDSFHEIKQEIKDFKACYAEKESSQYNIAIYALIVRLQELLNFMHKVHCLQEQLDQNQYDNLSKISKKNRFVDQKLALLSALTVFLTVMVTSLLWIFCGWDLNSSAMPMMAAVACSFFATLDSALPTLKLFMKCVIGSSMIVMLYTIFILPSISTFEMLVLVLSPLFIGLGILMTNPKTAFIGMVLATNIATLLGLKNNYQADVLTTLNGCLATVLGVSIAIFMMYALRSKQPLWVASQIEKYALKDIISTVQRTIRPHRYQREREHFIDRMLDKIYQFLPRVKNSNTQNIYEDTHIMQDIRLGVNLLDLKQYAQKQKSPDLYNQANRLIENILNFLELKIANLDTKPSIELADFITSLQTQHKGQISENQVSVVLYNIKISLFDVNTMSSHI